ncbi:MAG: hypothetical protein EA391_14910 [Balneolaceae bacterium]|nr:MAG: hypothetical protein EA391_14910 [Balneolaceae bacterium]
MEPRYLINELDIPFDAFFLPDGRANRRGAGRRIGDGSNRHQSRVEAGVKDFGLDLSGLGNSFKLQIELDRLPGNPNRRSVAIAPGNIPGSVHHVEYHNMPGNRFQMILHFIVEEGNDDKNHIDPTVFHPNEPGSG